MIRKVKINLPAELKEKPNGNYSAWYRDIPQCSAFEEYDTREWDVFNEYYVKFDKPNVRIDADSHEKRMCELYRDNPEKYFQEHRLYRMIREYKKEPAVRLGKANSNSYDVALKDVTHSYKGSEIIDGELYGIIDILNTTEGRKYQNKDNLVLEPFYEKTYEKLSKSFIYKIFYMVLKTK